MEPYQLNYFFPQEFVYYPNVPALKENTPNPISAESKLAEMNKKLEK